jgi:hypothetical protein
MFKRSHHQKIGSILLGINADLLRELNCYFGGGTAIALRFGEFRESVDIDFVVSDREGYRRLRELTIGHRGIEPLLNPGQSLIRQAREIRADQYGIRTVLAVNEQHIKFEIVLEGRVELSSPGPEDQICGVSTLTIEDMATTKLLANSDRWADAAVFNRDLLDLVMMELPPKSLGAAMEKATTAYGKSVQADLMKSIDGLLSRDGWMDRCLNALSIETPKAKAWEQVRAFQSMTEKVAGG